MIKTRSDYKNCIRRAKCDYDKTETDKLLLARSNNAKLYWRMLKGSCGIKEPNITMSNFELYFKAINSPDSHFFTADEDVLFFNER